MYTMCCPVLQKSCANDKISTLDHNGGHKIPIHGKSGQGMRIHFEELVNWQGKNELIPVYLDNKKFCFHLNREVKTNRDQQCERLLTIVLRRTVSSRQTGMAEQRACKSNW